MALRELVGRGVFGFFDRGLRERGFGIFDGFFGFNRRLGGCGVFDWISGAADFESGKGESCGEGRGKEEPFAGAEGKDEVGQRCDGGEPPFSAVEDKDEDREEGGLSPEGKAGVAGRGSLRLERIQVLDGERRLL
jgi:hypothetical protein